MSQVDLIVPLTEPEDGNDPNIAQEHPDVLRELWSDDMASLRNVFQMLRNMGVRRILKLMVKDNLQRPCSDEVIKECLKGIDIRYLDWRKEDLSADVVLSAAPNVVELWLYSSGRSSVLRGWSASNGVCNLNQVCYLAILFIKQGPGSHLANNHHDILSADDDVTSRCTLGEAHLGS
jgi:hypothetical protein